MAEVIDNSALIEAIDKMREEFNNQTQSAVINAALRSTFFIPAIIRKPDPETKLVQDKDNHLKFQTEEKPAQARFMLIKNNKEQTFFPVFTDEEEFKKMPNDQGFATVKMKFADIAGLTEQSADNIMGFVINPMGHNLPFTKDMLASIKNTLIEAKKKRDAEQAAAEAEAQGITATEGGAAEE